MARNAVQFQKGHDLAEFHARFGSVASHPTSSRDNLPGSLSVQAYAPRQPAQTLQSSAGFKLRDCYRFVAQARSI